jgi:hypothetical protein
MVQYLNLGSSSVFVLDSTYCTDGASGRRCSLYSVDPFHQAFPSPPVALSENGGKYCTNHSNKFCLRN